MYGPTNPIALAEHISKYRGDGESFLDVCNRLSGELADSDEHRRDIRMTFLHQNFMPAGRIQRAIGALLRVTPYNCFVSGTIEDDSLDIMAKVTESFTTMRYGGGIGYDFSTLRPRNAIISSLKSTSSGAVSFMEIFNSNCKTVRSAGGRRGAQMGVLRVDHPDIVEFIDAKTVAHANDTQLAHMLLSGAPAEARAQALEVIERVSIQNRLSAFNLSIGITDEFMLAVKNGHSFDLRFDGQTYETVDARALWNKIMRATWDWAEPGVLFLDTINKQNNLYYCEYIAATNPCAEQPLPPYGACLLGSWNAVKYVREIGGKRYFDYEAFRADIPGIVRAMDNVVDAAIYPLPQQESEAKNKRRMGLGFTGMANAIEAMGAPYASDEYLEHQSQIMRTLANEAYRASALLAKEKGPFPLWDREKFMAGAFVNSGVLDDDVVELVYEHGLRNSHLLSVAPTGTISLTADNISSGIEPVFSYSQERDIIQPDGVTKQTVKIEDYGVREFGVRGRRADELTPQEHVRVLIEAQKFVDSAISKTCNVGESVTFDEFKNVYWAAWEGGAKGCTTFRAAGKRFGVLRSLDTTESPEKAEPEVVGDVQGEACYIDPQTGKKTCE